MKDHEKKRALPTYEIWSWYRGALMGFAIINVVLFHFVKDYRTLHKVIPMWMQLYLRYIGSSGVDIFLFLSGFGLYYSFKRKNGKVNLKYYLITKLSRVLVPYFLLSVPGIIVRRIIHYGKDWTFVVKDLFFINFFQIGDSWYWYIGMICFCYLIFPLLYRYVEKADTNLKEMIRFVLLFGLVTAGCYLLTVYYADLYKNINGAVLRFFPFILGTFIGKRAYEKKPLTWVNAAWIVPWLCICSYTQKKPVLVTRYIFACNGLMACFFLCLIFFFVRKLKWHPIQDIWNYIGKYTLELYLAHVTVRVVMSWYEWLPGTYKKEAVMAFLMILLAIVDHVVSGWILKWINNHLRAGKK